MLVYASNPMGYFEIDGRRIYGRHFAYGSFPPTYIPLTYWEVNKDKFEIVRIDDKWLSKKTRKECPPFILNYNDDDLKSLNLQELKQLCEALKLDIHKKYFVGHRHTDHLIPKAERVFRRAILNAIEGLTVQ